MKDCRQFIKEAHRRGLRVITELVLNHTSSEHSWFQRARRAPRGSVYRDFYVWSDTADKYRDARIIFKDFETSNWTWDEVAGAYYWHRFYSHQPDLNFDNPRVRQEMLRVHDFWFNLGVDGMRLDAVPYLYEQEGTNCENLSQTHDFLKNLRKHVDHKFKNKIFLSEANQWPSDAAAYFGKGDESHMAFHFPLMPRMFMALRMEDSYPIIDILRTTPAIPWDCQWAIFLRNHDELTLEMVTDEERDYMYRVYAREPRAKLNLGIRRRLAPLMGNDRKKIELLNILLFSLPGTPVIYYGDELGMGDNYYLGDRNGVRTPMQWSPDKNAGFSSASPQSLYLPLIIDPEYHYEQVNVENQDKNLSSLLWWMRRVIAMRRRFKAFSRGNLEVLSVDNSRVLAFIRQYQDEIILVVVNLSRFSQAVEIDLSPYTGYVPEELFSHNRFPPIRESAYVLTLGPHNHFWLKLQKSRERAAVTGQAVLPEFSVKGEWENVLEGKARLKLEDRLLEYLKTSRWFSSKAKTLRQVRIFENAALPRQFPRNSRILLIEVIYVESPPETYILPLSFGSMEETLRINEEFPQAVIGRLKTEAGEGMLYDGTYDPEFQQSLLKIIAGKKKIKGRQGEFIASASRSLRRLWPDSGTMLPSHVIKAEQSNSSIIYDEKFFLKLYRRLDEGTNPELEILRALEEKGAANVPLFAGSIEYRRPNSSPFTASILLGYQENQGTGWTYMQEAVTVYFERVLSRRSELEEIENQYGDWLDMTNSNVPGQMQELIGPVYLEMASLLGKRTAEFHLQLFSLNKEDFAPEAFSLLYQKSLYQSMQGLVRRNFQLLRKNLKILPEHLQAEAGNIAALEPKILGRLQKITQQKINAMKIRIHGDYHLGQVLYTGKDFLIIDLEGEPARPLSERRLKHSPVKDLAGMIRSFHYATYNTLFLQQRFRPEDVPFLEKWVDPWYFYMSGRFIHAYLKSAEHSSLVPQKRDELEMLVQAFLLEKGVYELGYELNNRPDWVIIPMKGIKNIFG